MRQTKSATARLGVEKFGLRLRLCQFEMRFSLWLYVPAGLLVLLQSQAWGKSVNEEEGGTFEAVQMTERPSTLNSLCHYNNILLKKFLSAISNYYRKISALYECSRQNKIDPDTERVEILFSCIQSISVPADFLLPNNPQAELEKYIQKIKIKSTYLVNNINIGNSLCKKNKIIEPSNNKSILEIYHSSKSRIYLDMSDLLSTDHWKLVSRQDRFKVTEEEIKKINRDNDSDYYIEDKEGGDDLLRRSIPEDDVPTAMSQENVELEHYIQKRAAEVFHSHH